MNTAFNEKSGYFSALFKNSRVNACIQMDTSGTIQCINPAFKLSFGYDDGDLEGHHFSRLFTEADQTKGKPAEEIKKVLHQGQADDKNYLVHKDKSISWVSGESILVEHADGAQSLLKIIQDIDKEKHFEVSLSRANDFNAVILNAIDDFVVVLDKNMQVINYNPAFSNLFAGDYQPTLDSFKSFIHNADKRAELTNHLADIVKTGHPFNNLVVDAATPFGDKVFDIHAQPIFVEAEENLVLMVGHDITTQKRVEVEREDLMGFVAHELRNPLASILMSNDLMSYMIKQERTEQLTELLEKNKKHINRLNKMVAELYDAARLGGGNFILSKASFDFDDMLDEAVETFRVLQPGHTFTVTGKTGSSIVGDRYRIQQVVSNYLSNAVKYSDGVPRVTVDIVKSDNKLTVSVRDYGTGIAAEQMPYIFERFFRAEKTRNLEGIGLGLYLCRRIIQAHGGRVWAESDDGKGSAFYFSLPID